MSPQDPATERNAMRSWTLVIVLGLVLGLTTGPAAGAENGTFDCNQVDAGDVPAAARRLPPVYDCQSAVLDETFLPGDTEDWYVSYRAAGEPIHVEASIPISLVDPTGNVVTTNADPAVAYSSSVAGDWYIHAQAIQAVYDFRIWRYHYSASGENLLPANVQAIGLVFTASGLLGPSASGIDASWVKLPETGHGWEIGAVRTSGWIQYYDGNFSQMGGPLTDADGSGIAPAGAEWLVVSKPGDIRNIPPFPPPTVSTGPRPWTIDYYY